MNEPLTQEGEINAELIGLNKGSKFLKNKNLIIGIAGAVILFVILILIIILASSGSKPEEGGSSGSDTHGYVGEINCNYNIEYTSQNVAILGEEFSKKNKFDIFVDGEKIEFSKEYKFSTVGRHKIQIKLYGEYKWERE